MLDLTFAPLSAELHNGEGREPLLLIQGESAGRRLTMTLLNGGTPLDLTAAAAVALYCTKPDGTEEQLPCVVEDAANGTVSVTFTSSSCSVAGDMRQVILRITWSDASNSRYVGPRIHVAPSPSDTAAESSNEFALLDQLIIQAQEAIGGADEAASAANTAAGAVNDAKDAANTAASAANAAATAANTAKDAANAAAGAANAAAGAANTAAGAANTAADRANQAAEDAEAVLNGAVTSVNGKTGAVTLAAADVGALPTAGGEISGDLNVHGDLGIKGKNIASFEVDQGITPDGWTYCKHSNGIYELWIRKDMGTVEMTHNTSYDVFYANLSIALPSDVATVRCANVNTKTNGYCYGDVSGISESKIDYRLISATSASPDVEMMVYVLATYSMTASS